MVLGKQSGADEQVEAGVRKLRIGVLALLLLSLVACDDGIIVKASPAKQTLQWGWNFLSPVFVVNWTAKERQGLERYGELGVDVSIYLSEGGDQIAHYRVEKRRGAPTFTRDDGVADISVAELVRREESAGAQVAKQGEVYVVIHELKQGKVVQKRIVAQTIKACVIDDDWQPKYCPSNPM